MNILSTQNLGKSHGLKTLFSGLSFGIDARDRIGIIGVNGCGKSTLLRVLARREEADAGTITSRADLRIAWLPQNPEFDENQTVLEHLFATEGALAALVGEYEALCRRLARTPEDAALLREIAALNRRMDAAGAWEFETRAKTILTRLGVEDFDARLATLSGGYRKRVALARTLLSDSELLALDEPTNHLDADTVAWLEGWLARYGGAVVLVTHDRYFLDRVTRRIIELDRGEPRLFDGNFSYYLAKKAEVEAAFGAWEERRRAILRDELAWLARGARARSTKQKAHIQRIEALTERNYERPREEIRFDTQTRRLGRKILDMNGVGKAWGGRWAVRDFTHAFARGERLGVLGPNGCGKTTLVHLMTGRLAPDAGTIDAGDTVVFSAYEQENEGLDPNERAIDYVRREGGELLRAPDGAAVSATVMMERFLFTPQMQYAPIGKLSGGERRRLYLVRTLMRDPNFLVLDEPTNDLDIMTLEALEDFLTGYEGCLVVISHDRYFLDRTVDRVVAFEGDGRWREWPGGYTMYAEFKARMAEQTARDAVMATRDAHERAAREARYPPVRRAKNVPKPSAPDKAGEGDGEAVQSSTARKLTWKESRELESIEEEIPALEVRLRELEHAMAAHAADYDRLRAAAADHAAAQTRLEIIMSRWEILASRREAAGG